jgi:hypothetical protein
MMVVGLILFKFACVFICCCDGASGKSEEERRECVRIEREREVESELWTGLFVHVHSLNRFDPHSLSKPIHDPYP